MLPRYKTARKSDEELYLPGASRFPYTDSFEIRKGLAINSRTVIRTLSPLLTDERLARFEAVCRERTFNVLPIVETPYDLGNLAAVCRSADALGYGAVHVIKGQGERYKQSKRASAGSEKWLDVRVFDSTEACLTNAQRQGYQIVATHLRADAVDISQVDWSRPTAFVLGNEKEGVSQTAVDMADACAVIPILGFVESYNVSVASALIMWEARQRRLAALGYHGDLSEEEQRILKAALLLRHKGSTPRHIELLLGRPPPDWQLHRDKAWGGKTFIAGGGDSSVSSVSSSAEEADAVAEAAERARIAAALAAGGPPPPPPQKRTCHFWNGQVCFGEALFWPGKKCRYAAFHLHGVDTIEPYKLQQECERRHIPNPQTAAAAAMPACPSPEAVAAAALEAAAVELAAAQPT